MDKVKRFKNVLIFAFVAIIFAFCLPLLFASAEENEEDDRPVFEIGKVTKGVAVREGPGEEDYPRIKIDGAEVSLEAGETVTIIGSAYYEKGKKDWYHIIFYRNTQEYEGWVTSSKVSKTGETIMATPTPTPSPTPSPEPTATSTPTPTVTPGPTSIVPPGDDTTKNAADKFWRFVIGALVVMVVIIIAIFIYNKITYSKNRNNEIDRKMKYLKNADLGDKEEGELTSVKRPTVRVVGESAEAPADETVDSQRELRARIDRLKQHDIVTHKYFGKGEVFDNSDVKLMEVRFGLDVRYLNKDSLVAKHLLTFDDDEKRPTKRKL